MSFAKEQNDAGKRSHSGTYSVRNSRQFRTPTLPIISLYDIADGSHRNMIKIHHNTVKITVLFPQNKRLLLSNKLLL